MFYFLKNFKSNHPSKTLLGGLPYARCITYVYGSDFDSVGNFVLTAQEHSAISNSKMNSTYHYELVETWSNLYNTYDKFNRSFVHLNASPVSLTHGAHANTVSQLDHNRVCYHLFNNHQFNRNIKRDQYGELVYTGILDYDLLTVLTHNPL